MRMIEGRICARAVDEWLHYRDRSIDKHYCDVSGGDAIFLLFRAPGPGPLRFVLRSRWNAFH